jgi:hypothetical protein
MKHEKVKSKLIAHGGALNHVFRQHNDSCRAYVAMWLRGYAKDDSKGFWKEKYFALHEGRQITTDSMDGKIDDLMKMEDLPRKESDRVLSEFLVLGKKQGKTKSGSKVLNMASKSIEARLVKHMLSDLEKVSVGENLLFLSLAGGNGHHACGLDFSYGSCVYFDPNFGEVFFSNFTKFKNWFNACWADRDFEYGYTVFDYLELKKIAA